MAKKNKRRNIKEKPRATRSYRAPAIYIGFITAGILIVAGMFSLKQKHEFSAEGLHLPPSVSPVASILFGGDMMFDRTIRTTAEVKGGDYLFECLDPLLKKEDLVVANLEGPITDNTSISQFSQMGDGNNFTFTFPPTTAALLYAHNIRLVNLGNNHSMNFGADGIQSTMHALQGAQVGYFGDPLEQSVAEKDIDGMRFAFINYNQFWYKSRAALTETQIKDVLAKGEIPIVFTHWGEEYLPATEYEKELAHRFVDAGAVLVIGTHPHVVQEHEVYKGKNIYYSLGNLIFDQYFDDAVEHGLMVEARFGKDGIKAVKEIPVTLKTSRQTCETN